MSVTDRLLAELRTHPSAVPVPLDVLAERLQCSPEDVLAAGEALLRRAPGDDELVTVVMRTSEDGIEEYFLAMATVPLNDEPDTT